MRLQSSLCKAIFWLALAAGAARGQTNLLDRPVSRAEAVEIALLHNSAILKGQRDLEAAHGVVIQLKSTAYPSFSVGGAFNREQTTLVPVFPLPPSVNTIQFPYQSWSADIRVQQSIYAGGRITSSFRSAKLTKQQALLNYQTLLADTLLQVRVAYDDVLLAQQQITVNEASVKLLTNELNDVRERFKAGKVPNFDVLRAHVELANETPKLSQARNNFRISKNNLLNLLGYNLPQSVWEDVPLKLSDTLTAAPWELELPSALAKAVKERPELEALRKTAALRHEEVVRAQSGYKPSAEIFGGYNWESPPYTRNLNDDLYGWTAGAQISWNIWDSGLTRGKIVESRANFDRAQLDIDDTRRQIELDVRTAYSTFIEARELLDSQKAVQEEAEEALRLAEERMKAGSSTQLDVLNAQTSLTQSRTTLVQAMHDYSVARARMQRAIGEDMEIVQK